MLLSVCASPAVKPHVVYMHPTSIRLQPELAPHLSPRANEVPAAHPSVPHEAFACSPEVPEVPEVPAAHPSVPREAFACSPEVPDAHPSTPPLSDIDTQREAFERVADMEEQICRLRVTHGTRVDQLDSPHFTHTGSAARRTQARLVSNASAAINAHAKHNGRITQSQADAIVDETLVALMNDLMMSGAAGNFFGVSIPPGFVIDLNAPPEQWHQRAMGLLVYRTWQLIVRTRVGRSTLLACSSDKNMTFDEGAVDSYEAIRDTISLSLLEGDLALLLHRCVTAMPTATDETNRALREKRLTMQERHSLVGAMAEGSLVFTRAFRCKSR